MRIDLHVHTNSHDSRGMSPARLIDRAHRIGLDGFASTNHDSVEAGMECVEYGRRVGFPVFPGVEISTDRGHLLVYGLADDGWDPRAPSGLPKAGDVLARLPRARVAVFLAHPFFDVFHPDRDSILSFLPLLDGVESINGSKFLCNRFLREKMAGIEMRGIGGSDAHEPERLGDAYTVFTGQVGSIEAFVAELKTGEIRPVMAIAVPDHLR